MNAQLEVEISGKLDGLQAALNQAMGKIDDFVNKTKNGSDKVESAFKKMERAGSALSDIGGRLSVALTAPIVLLGKASLTAYAQMDSLKRGLSSVMGGAEQANVELAKLTELAKMPGIGLKEAVSGSINLQAIGVSADAARKAMGAFANAIATVGGGAQNFDLAIRGFAQLTNSAKPLQQDLYQIANQLPQVNKLMIDAFGTSRAEDLAALGITGKQLADFLVDGLSKLPKVTGGIQNAMENLEIAFFSASAKMGEALDKAFGLEEAFNKLGDTVTEFTEWFTKLDPTIQKIIFSVVGLTVVIGPLSLIIGQVLTMIPRMAVGFAALTGPIGLMVIAITAATAAIVYFWDEIKATLQDSGLWDAAIEAFRDGTKALVSYMKYLRDQIVIIWNAIKTVVIPIVKAIWDVVSSIFKNALIGLASVFRGFAKLFSGDWSGLADIVKGIFGGLWNSVIDIMVTSVRTVGGIFAGLFEALGATEWAAKIRSGIESVVSTVKKAKVTFGEFAQAQSNLFQGDVLTLGGTTGGAGNADGTGGAGGGNLKPKKEEIEEQSEAFKDAVQSYKEYLEELKRLKSEFERINVSLISSNAADQIDPITGNPTANPLSGKLPTIDPKVISGIKNTGIAQRQEEQKAFNDELQSTIDKLSVISPLTNAIGEQFTNLVTNGTFSFKAIGEALKQLITKLITAAATAAIFAALTGGFSATATGGGFLKSFKGILGFADGGVVTKPTLGMIGEAGQSEAVIPLPRLFSQMNNIFKAGQGSNNVGLQGITVVVNQDRFGNWNLNQQVETYRNRVG